MKLRDIYLRKNKEMHIRRFKMFDGGMCVKEVAKAEGMSERGAHKSIKLGLEHVEEAQKENK